MERSKTLEFINLFTPINRIIYKDYRRSSRFGTVIGYACAPGAYLAGGVVSKTFSVASKLTAKGEELFWKVWKKEGS